MARQFPLVVQYSFDDEVPVWLFSTEADALAEMQKQVQEEVRVAKETWGDGVKIEHHIDVRNGFAEIKETFPDRVDETSWTIGSLKN